MKDMSAEVEARVSELVEELLPGASPECADFIDDARVQAPGLALEDLVDDLNRRGIPVSAALRQRILDVAVWPELREYAEQMKVASPA